MSYLKTFSSMLALSFIFALQSGAVNAQELFLKSQIGDTDSAPMTEDHVILSSNFKLKTGTNQGLLTVEAKVADHWHVYSITQPKGGPRPSKLKLEKSDDFKLTGVFTATPKPKTRSVPEFDVKVEEHEGKVTWTAPITIESGADPKALKIKITYGGQACESKEGGVCIPLFGIKTVAAFAGFQDNLSSPSTENSKLVVAPKAEPFAPGSLHAELTARIYHEGGDNINPGDKVKLEIVATPDKKFHIYAFEEGKANYMATRIALTETNGWKVVGPKASTKPHLDNSLGIDLEYHEGPVKWTYDVEIPKTATESSYSFTGLIGLQTCDEAQCDPPSGAEFSFKLQMGKTPSANATFVQKTYGTAKKAQAALAEKK